MKRYQKLIIDACEKDGYTPVARAIGVPSTSLHEWVTQPRKTPHYKSLVYIAEYFKVPLPTLLMEVSDQRSYDDEIVEALFTLSDEQKRQTIEFITRLLQN